MNLLIMKCLFSFSAKIILFLLGTFGSLYYT